MLNAKSKAPQSINIPWLTWKQSTQQLLEKMNFKSKFYQGSKIQHQLFVDVSELIQRDVRSGIQRVTRSILSELLADPPAGFCVKPVYATLKQGYRYACSFTSRFLGHSEFDLIDNPIEYHAGDVFLGLDLQPQVVVAHQDFLNLLRNQGVGVHFLVHDLLPITLPKAFPVGTNKLYQKWLEVVTQSDSAVCVSKNTADELMCWLKDNGSTRQNQFRIYWSHNGADIKNSRPTKGIPEDAVNVFSALAEKPSFLAVGTLEPRKGYAQALLAFELLWAEGVDVNFIIVGKQGWQVESLVDKLRHHAQLGRRLFWLEGISDEYLEKVYAVSTCLIAVSEGEGFGLPLIEAAQHKLPIIARDIPVFREVAGEHAFYFSGLEPQNLANAIKNWIMLNAKSKAPQSINIPWLTWKQSTQQLLEKILSGATRSDFQVAYQADSIIKGD
jgi:glycosyltransferase involved in cell wall biosynthesis